MDSNTLYTAITAWAVCAAVACALLVVYLQNRSAKRLTCLQLFMQLAAQYDSVDMQRTRVRLASKLLSYPTTVEINDSLLVFYENIAILHRRGLLDSELMDNTFSIDVRSYWAALRHYVEYMRKTFGDNKIFFELEKLNDHFVKEAQSQEGTPLSNVGLTAEAIQGFLRCEVLRNDEQLFQARNIKDTPLKTLKGAGKVKGETPLPENKPMLG
jgi:hypothetical protein